MGEDIDTLKLEDISRRFKIGCGVLIAAFLFHFIGMTTNHWAVAATDAYGTIQYNGLWEKCSDIKIGRGVYECGGFIWSDPQVSHWFRYIQTTEILSFCGLLLIGVLIMFYLFAPFFNEHIKKNIRLVSFILLYLCGIFIIVGCIVFGSLKNVQKPKRMQDAYVSLSWSFAFTLIGGLLSLVTGVIFTISS